MYTLKKVLLFIVFVTSYFAIVMCCNDREEPSPDIVGTFTWTEWQKKSGWKDHSASDYVPDSNCVQALSNLINGVNCIIRFEIYASNWCHADCEPQLPRMIKFLKAAGTNVDDIIIYGINRTKTEPVAVMEKWKNNFPEDNCYLPTLVIYISDNVSKVKCETDDYPDWQCKITAEVANILLESE